LRCPSPRPHPGPLSNEKTTVKAFARIAFQRFFVYTGQINESKALTLSNEWLQPETIGKVIKEAPSIIASLTKLTKSLTKSF